MIKSVKNKWIKIYFTIVFFYFFIIRFLVIPSGDDFFWGGKPGKYLLQHGFYGPQSIYGGSSNGRYIGNILEIFTVHHLIPAMLMFGFFWTLLIWSMWNLSGRTKLNLILSSLFVFTLQSGYLSTIFSWNAGFINYVPPVSLILLYLVLVKKSWQNQLPQNKYLLSGIAFLISLIGGLFVEHLTIYQIFIGIMVMIIGQLIFKKPNKLFNTSYLLGAVTSAIIMFSHPAYHESSVYRNINFNLSALINNFVNISHFWFNTLNVVVNIVICLAIIAISFKKIENVTRRKYLNITAGFFALYYLIMDLWLNTQNHDQFFVYPQLRHLSITSIDSLITIFFWIFLIYVMTVLFDFSKDYLIYFSIFTYFALISPFLLIISPISVREFFTAYLFLYLAMILFVQKALSLYSSKLRLNIKIITAIILLISAINVQTKMTINYQANLNRVQEESFLSGKSSLRSHVPYRKYVSSNDALLQQSGSYWKKYLKKNWLERL